jgi:hypothetical protein
VTVRRSLAIVWVIGAFLVMLWCWMSFSGPYRWFAEWQMQQFGSYELKLTLFGPLIVLLIPVGFLVGWGPLAGSRGTTPEVRVANARRNARTIALLGLAALAIGAAGGGLGYLKLQTPLTHADLVLNAGTEVSPAADLVTVTAIARPDLIVSYEETIAGVTNQWSFVPLVAPAWRHGDPIRYLLKTNQTGWSPPAGTGGSSMPHMLVSGNPPFRMITEPSVLAQHGLPGAVQVEYEKAHIPLDPTVAVVEQSEAEVFTPYWITAGIGGLIGFCLLVGGLIGAVNAGKAARA